MTVFMTFDKEAAQKAGGSDFINETGEYVGKIKAKAITAKSGALGIELSIKTDQGLTGNYISIYFQKANGETIKSGYNHLQSMMGLLRVGTLQQPVSDGNGDFWIKEFDEKRIGLVLQKRLYSKTDGSDGYDFQLRAVFDADTQQTYKEKSEDKPAEKVRYLDESLKDIDERGQNHTQTQNQQSEAPDNFDF